MTQVVEIEGEDYVKFLNLIAQVKLKRYEAYACVRAPALLFRDPHGAQNARQLTREVSS